MQLITIEPGVPFQESTHRIEEVDYILSFRWNFRREVWALALYNVDRELIYSMSSLLLGTYSGILATHNLDFPNGAFFIIDTEGDNNEATLDSLGSTHKVLYLTAEDIITS